jgi:hypothetical protein
MNPGEKFLRRSLLLGPIAVALLLAGVAGCGSGQGRVSGQVLYNKKPLPGGLLTFVPTDTTKRPVAAAIDENGHYNATVPLGEVRIAVDNRELQAAERPIGALPPPGGIKLPAAEKQGGAAKESPSAQKRPPGTYVPIPSKYYDVRTSELSYTVHSGSRPHDVELK